MSTAYYPYCLDCKSRSGIEEEDIEYIRSLARHARALAGLEDLCGETRGLVFLNVGGREIYTGWFAQHKGHHIVVRSEYGIVDGQCTQLAKCLHCGHQDNCVLPDGHEPPCRVKDMKEEEDAGRAPPSQG